MTNPNKPNQNPESENQPDVLTDEERAHIEQIKTVFVEHQRALDAVRQLHPHVWALLQFRTPSLGALLRDEASMIDFLLELIDKYLPGGTHERQG